MQTFNKLTRWFTKPHTKDLDPRNFLNVQIDAIGVALGNTASPFLPVFLTRLGADAFHIGLLSSMPGITGLLTAIPLGRFLQGKKNVVPWFSAARLAVLLSYALTSIATLLFKDHTSIYAILVIWALATIPQTVVAISFNVVMGAVAGPTGRYELMSRRWSIMGVSTALFSFLVGILLDNVAFPLNYQLAFFILSIGAFLSYRFSSHIEIPDQVNQPKKGLSIKDQLAEYKTLLRGQTRFTSFVLRRFVFSLGQYFIMPVLPLYLVREVKASDAWIAIFTTVQTAILILGYTLWIKQTRKRGSRFVLLIGTFCVGLFPFLLSTTHLEWLIAIFYAFLGIFAAGLNLVFFDELMKTIPPQYAATFNSISQSMEYLAALIGPMLGSLISNQIGLTFALIISGTIRLMGFILFLIDKPAKQPALEDQAGAV